MGDANPRPNRKDPVPQGLDWDAKQVLLHTKIYHDIIIQDNGQRLNYGTGTFGDMGCHIYDPTFKALGLTYPISLRSKDRPPIRIIGDLMKIDYIFLKLHEG